MIYFDSKTVWAYQKLNKFGNLKRIWWRSTDIFRSEEPRTYRDSLLIHCFRIFIDKGVGKTKFLWYAIAVAVDYWPRFHRDSTVQIEGYKKTCMSIDGVTDPVSEGYWNSNFLIKNTSSPNAFPKHFLRIANKTFKFRHQSPDIVILFWLFKRVLVQNQQTVQTKALMKKNICK